MLSSKPVEKLGKYIADIWIKNSLSCCRWFGLIVEYSSYRHENMNRKLLISKSECCRVGNFVFNLSLALFPQRQTLAIHQPSLTVTALKKPEIGNWSEINCKTCGQQGKEFDYWIKVAEGVIMALLLLGSTRLLFYAWSCKNGAKYQTY